MDKIATIKEVRDITGCGLRESKDIVESWQNGEMPERKELMAMVAERVKNRVPRSEEIRKRIRDQVKGIKNVIEYVDEAICEGDFDEKDLGEIRLSMEKIADGALDVKDRWTYRLEDALEAEKGE